MDRTERLVNLINDLSNNLLIFEEDPSGEIDRYLCIVEQISNQRVDYSAISRFVLYESSNHTREEEKLEILEINLDLLIEYCEKEKIELEKTLFKIKDHINLTLIQKKFNADYPLRNLKSDFSELVESNKDIEAKIDSLEIKKEKVEDEIGNLQKNIYITIITVLGIFAAIMMGTMGAFQGFASVFSNAENLPVGKILLISAAGASGVSLILFLLLHSISKLTSYTISNCDCHKKRSGGISAISESFKLRIFGGKPGPQCTCSLFNKYPAIIIVNYLFYYIALTGFIFMYFNFYDYFDMKWWCHLLIIVGFYSVATVILIFVHRYIIDKNSNEKSITKLVKDCKKVKSPGYFKSFFTK